MRPAGIVVSRHVPRGRARARWKSRRCGDSFERHRIPLKKDRARGRAPRGQRLRMSVPHGHWKTTTFVGALRLTGMTAPMVLDGP